MKGGGYWNGEGNGLTNKKLERGFNKKCKNEHCTKTFAGVGRPGSLGGGWPGAKNPPGSGLVSPKGEVDFTLKNLYRTG